MAGGDGRGGASAGTPGNTFEIPRIVGHSECGVLRRGPHAELVEVPAFQEIMRIVGEFDDIGDPPYRLEKGEDEAEVDGLFQLKEKILQLGRKGLGIQRYKGLGEMNPQQLWETTMDPEKRTLLKVQIEDPVDADDMFTILMGDKVEPRREFIQNNALEVTELDV